MPECALIESSASGNARAVGALASDFTVERLSPTGNRAGGEMFQLASTRGKPVALIFCSYT